MILFIKTLSVASGKSLIMNFLGGRYAFNVFEGFQRACLEQHISISSIKAYFLSERFNLPAIAGTYLTLANENHKGFIVVNDNFLDLEPIKRFVTVPKDINVISQTEFKSQGLEVDPFVINEVSNYLLSVRQIKPTFKYKDVPDVIPKSFYTALSNGEKIVYNGITYDGSNYLEKLIEYGQICIIFSHDSFDILLEKCANVETFICMNNLAKKAIVSFLKKRGNNANVYYVEDNCFVEAPGLYNKQTEMNEANPEFLLPNSPDDRFLPIQSLIYLNQVNASSQNQPMENTTADPLETHLNMEQLIKDIRPPFTASDAEEDADGVTILRNGDLLDFVMQKQFVNTKAAQQEYLANKNDKVFPSIMFLGTACAIPTKFRNVSSILYESEDSVMIMDCGEDSVAQILRVYGNLDVLNKLKVLYLSHSHADHVLGVPGLLRHVKHKIIIIGPEICQEYIERTCYGHDSPIKHSYIYTNVAKPLESLFYEHHGPFNMDNRVCDNINIQDYSIELKVNEFVLRICGCPHLFDSVSVKVTDTSNGKVFAYSGDTMPSSLFACCAKDADVLIHESTFIDGQEKNAIATNHSLEREAREIFYRSGAKRLFLTHFSNRNNSFKGQQDFVADFFRYKIE